MKPKIWGGLILFISILSAVVFHCGSSNIDDSHHGNSNRRIGIAAAKQSNTSEFLPVSTSSAARATSVPTANNFGKRKFNSTREIKKFLITELCQMEKKRSRVLKTFDSYNDYSSAILSIDPASPQELAEQEKLIKSGLQLASELNPAENQLKIVKEFKELVEDFRPVSQNTILQLMVPLRVGSPLYSFRGEMRKPVDFGGLEKPLLPTAFSDLKMVTETTSCENWRYGILLPFFDE